MDIFRFGWKYWKKYLPLDILVKVFSLVAILCDLLLPLLSAGIIDYVIAYDPSSPVDEGFIQFLFDGSLGAPASGELFLHLVLIFAGVFLVRIVLLYAKNVTFQWCGVAMECTLRAETYAKLLELDGETLSRYNVGELLTTMNRDTISFKELYSRMILNIFDSVIVIVLSVITLTMLDWRLLFLPVAVAPFFTVALVRYLRKAKVLFKEIRESYSAINLTVQENIDAVRIVRSFAGEETERHKFDRDNERVYALNKKEAKLSAKYNSIFTLCQQVGYVGTVCVAFALVLSGSIALGSLTAATTYVTKIISHIMQISRSFYMMQNQLVSGARLKKFLTEEGAIHDSRALRTAPQKPHFRFEDVSLTLGEKAVLKHITLDLPYGKKLGVMGGTGSGKSVLLKSLSRIYDVTAGDITLDGTDIRDYSLEALRSEFAYVFQDVFLFSNTVDANIAFAHPDVPEEEVVRATQIAQADQFIGKLEAGYETVVGERGVGLSGGQKQRLSIARALIKGAPVLVLDDASSALDMATERRVLTSIKEHCPDSTLVIAAHRVSSVLDCDEIIYLRDGEIIERGTAEELIAKNGAFAAVYHLQTSDGQLDDSSYGRAEL